MKYMSPRSDIGFKKLFGSSNHKNLTINAINFLKMGISSEMIAQRIGLTIEQIEALKKKL